ncbi:hypothetical protein V6N13_043589 [Hibiscus sabdariffa]
MASTTTLWKGHCEAYEGPQLQAWVWTWLKPPKMGGDAGEGDRESLLLVMATPLSSSPIFGMAAVRLGTSSLQVLDNFVTALDGFRPGHIEGDTIRCSVNTKTDRVHPISWVPHSSSMWTGQLMEALGMLGSRCFAKSVGVVDAPTAKIIVLPHLL